MRRFGCLMLLVFGWVSSIRAADPVGMAAEGRIDVLGDSMVGAISDGAISLGRGQISRMNWLPADQQDLGYSIQLPASHRNWREFEIRFTPAKSGTVSFGLMGPWVSAGRNQLVRQEVEWDSLSAQGTVLPQNAGFEDPSGWQLQGGSIVTGTAARPAQDGQKFARSWHNGRVVAVLPVTAGTPVRIRGYLRSAIPAGYREMTRILSHETPAHQNAKKFLHGVNLGNYLEAPRGQDWGQNYTSRDFEEIRKAGFDHVRIPIGWQNYTGPGPQFILEEEIFGKVDPLVQWALDHQLNVIINVHHFDDFTTAPAAHKDRLVAIWEQLARRYAKLPESVAFELLNEPKDAATTTVLNPIYQELIAAIRTTNPTRPIFVGPGQFNRVAELANLNLPESDQNLIVTVHSYDPYYFTHQGASWGDAPIRNLRGVQFPGPPQTPLAVPEGASKDLQNWLGQYNTLPADRNPCSPRAMRELVADAREWSEYYGRPVHFGEFGAYFVADAQSRASYCREYRQAIEEAGLGWALWDWSAGFRYWDKEKNQPVEGMPDALFGPAASRE